MAARKSAKNPSTSSSAFDIVVRGDGIAPLLAALDCARIGLRTNLVSQGEWTETRSEGSARAGVIAETCQEFGVSYEVVRPADGEQQVLGIPGSPLSRNVREKCGWRGAWRIYLDRVRPLLAIGEERNLARLVTTRLGRDALETLVRPRVNDMLLCEPEDVDVVDCVPELLPAMSRVGSLTLGVLELAAADPNSVATVVPRGGFASLETAIALKATHFAVSRRSQADEPVIAQITVDLTAAKFTQALDRAIPLARALAQDARAAIFADADYRPIGPVDLER